MSCVDLSERMPLVASGRGTWSEDERRHFESCADCTTEWRVVLQASQVGSTMAGHLDAARTSARVLHRLATEPARAARSRGWWFAGTGIAAAVLLLVLFRPWAEGSRMAPPATAFEIPIVELDSLSHAQLRLVLESIEEPLETPTPNEAPSMLDLDDTQLERVLRSLEG